MWFWLASLLTMNHGEVTVFLFKLSLHVLSTCAVISMKQLYTTCVQEKRCHHCTCCCFEFCKWPVCLFLGRQAVIPFCMFHILLSLRIIFMIVLGMPSPTPLLRITLHLLLHKVLAKRHYSHVSYPNSCRNFTLPPWLFLTQPCGNHTCYKLVHYFLFILAVSLFFCVMLISDIVITPQSFIYCLSLLKPSPLTDTQVRTYFDSWSKLPVYNGPKWVGPFLPFMPGSHNRYSF